LITTTYYSSGSSIYNPVTLVAGVPIPINIPLPPRIVPSQSFIGKDSSPQAAGVALITKTVLPSGTIFSANFTIPVGIELQEGEANNNKGDSLV
jgi:hypothetical protein